MLFVLAGAGFLAYWLVADPSHDSVKEGWAWVLAFTGFLFLLAVACAGFARMVGGRSVTRWAAVACLGFASAGIANVFEDGFGMGWAFLWFVLSTAVSLVGLLATTLAVALTQHGYRRLLALVPAGTFVGCVLFVEAGGAIMLLTWSGAALAALLVHRPHARLAAS